MTGLPPRWTQPSLLRRLLLGQALTLALLWLGLFAWLLQAGATTWQREAREIFERESGLIFHAASVLGDQPALLAESIALLDEHARQSVLIDSFRLQTPGQSVDVWPLTMTSRDQLFVWLDGRSVYRSPGALSDAALQQLRTEAGDGVSSLGQRHRFDARSADGRTQVTLLVDSSFVIRLAREAPTLLLLPLLLSMPLLLLPAWISVRRALRPLYDLGHDIAQRRPDDLSPLRTRPPHRELRHLGEKLDALLSGLAEVRQRERGFIANAAHELRTPLAAVKLNAQALTAQHDPAEQPALLDGLLRSNARAERLVGQLLDLARSESIDGAACQERLDLAQLVQDSLADQAALARQAGVELDFRAPPVAWMLGDRESLRSLLDNLIGNAIKYSPRGGTVLVTLSRADDGLRLCVQDQGPGIPEAQHEAVFQRFYRVPGQAKSGCGLGLAIVQSVLERHQGRIRLGRGPGGTGLSAELLFAAAPSP